MATDAQGRYYQLVLIWLKDAEKFTRYLELMRPIVQRYGGAAERVIAPASIHASAMATPDIANVVFYDSRDAFTSFHQDPAFRAIVHLRSESIDMAQVSGMPVRGDAGEDGLDGRLYVVEVTRFGPEGAAGYRRYEEQEEPALARHGYRVERVVAADSASGFGFEPDLARIGYFEDAGGLTRLEEDPAHARIAKELYPAAVRESVRVIGRAVRTPD
jgi:uncharacterized protein (DUF1330 family)